MMAWPINSNFKAALHATLKKTCRILFLHMVFSGLSLFKYYTTLSTIYYIIRYPILDLFSQMLAGN